MITDWQGVWGYKVPFVVVQLHTWGYMPCDEEDVLANELESGIRLAQWDVGRHNESRVALVSAVDLGGSLHPPYKSEVGRRVALATVGTVFYQTVKWQYPFIRNATGNLTKGKFEVDVYVENAEGLQMVDTPSQIRRSALSTAARTGHLACLFCWYTTGAHSTLPTHTIYRSLILKVIMFISQCWPMIRTRGSLTWLEFSINFRLIRSVL